MNQNLGWGGGVAVEVGETNLMMVEVRIVNFKNIVDIDGFPRLRSQECRHLTVSVQLL